MSGNAHRIAHIVQRIENAGVVIATIRRNVTGICLIENNIVHPRGGGFAAGVINRWPVDVIAENL